MKKLTIQEVQSKFKELAGEPIDWRNFNQLAEDCWLFLTNDKLPEKAIIKRVAFLHEVSIMIRSTVQMNQLKLKRRIKKLESYLK